MQTTEILTLVINLDRAPDRMRRISEQLQQLGLHWQRVVGMDGNTFDWTSPKHLDRQEFCRRHGKLPLSGEVGCYLSHVKAIRAFLSSTAQWGLILEDDVQLNPSLPQVLNRLKDSQERWDLVKLSGVHRGTPLKMEAVDDAHDLVVMLSKCTGASAYLLNRKAAGVFAAGLLPVRIPFDHEFDRAWHWGLKTRSVLPFPCHHDQVIESTINYADRPRRRFPWYRRFSAYAWRIQNAWNQLAYGLGQWWSAKPGRGPSSRS